MRIADERLSITVKHKHNVLVQYVSHKKVMSGE